MPRKLALCLLLVAVPALAAAQADPQGEAVGAPSSGSEHAVAPAPASPPKWSLGVGLGFLGSSEQFYGYEYFSPGGVAGLGGSYWFDTSPAVGALVAPRLTVLAERRVSESVFVTFQVAASYGQSQNQMDPALKAHRLDLEGDLGVRHVLNPKGIVEVSWFATVGVRYANVAAASALNVWDPETQAYTSSRMDYRGHTFAVGALAGIALERELVENLSLRLSTSVLGASYGLTSSNASTADASADARGDEFDVGLKLNPMLALRYAF